MIDFLMRLIAWCIFVLIGYAASSLIALSLSYTEWDVWLRGCFVGWCIFFGCRMIAVEA